MKKHDESQTRSWCIAFLSSVVTLAGCGEDSTNQEDELEQQAAAVVTNVDNNEKLNIVARWWVPTLGDGDHRSTRSTIENPGGTFEGQMFYLPATSTSGTTAIYRLYQATLKDHMESVTTNEGGYDKEDTLGYAFSSQVEGTSAVRRFYKASIADHLVAFANESPTGYALEGTGGYGYPRYGLSCEVPLSVIGNQIKLVANKAAGGAISELWWNGKQFINNFDYGRQIQTAFNLTNQGEEDNPTEAGDRYGCPGVKAAGWAHGSPLLTSSVIGKTLFTKTHPLQWTPANFGGGSTNPVRWKGTISKTVTLDVGSNNAISWTSQIYFPKAQSVVSIEVLTAYLLSDFNRFYAYNAATNVLTELTASVPSGGCMEIPSPPAAGGIIIATADGAYALGGYRSANNNGFALCDFRNNGSSTGKYGSKTTKWSILERPVKGITANTTKTNKVFLTVGTLTTAKSEMRRLYLSP